MVVLAQNRPQESKNTIMDSALQCLNFDPLVFEV